MALRNHPSPNFGTREIPVEFLVLHYTACSLPRTLEIFGQREMKVCAHFVLAQDGDLYDLGGFWSGPARQGAHAGLSRWRDEGGREWERFNEFSIGVEIVNENGNLFPYTDAQYHTLAELALHLQDRYPALRDPARVLGHEQIAGFRGKVDPGHRFDWPRFFREAYSGRPAPSRAPTLSPAQLAAVERRWREAPAEDKARADFWERFSSELEQSVRGTSST